MQAEAVVYSFGLFLFILIKVKDCNYDSYDS
jgi:hypothetical protein